MTFFDNLISYTQYFSEEICNSTWYSCHSIENWKLRDSISERRAVQNCRRRVLKASKVNLTTPYCTDDFSNLGMPLLSSVELPVLIISLMKFQKAAAFYPACPFDECSSGSMLSYSDRAMNNFISQSILSIKNSCCYDFCDPQSAIFMFNFVLQSKEHYRRFMNSCHQAVNSRKQHTRNFRFKSLGHSSILSAKGKHADVDSESLRLQQMQETHRKFYAITEDSPRNLSWPRKALVHEVFSDGFVQNHRKKCTDDIIDNLLYLRGIETWS